MYRAFACSSVCQYQHCIHRCELFGQPGGHHFAACGGPWCCQFQPQQACSASYAMQVPPHPELSIARLWQQYHDPAVCGVSKHISRGRRVLQNITPCFNTTWWLSGLGYAGGCPFTEHLVLDSTCPVVSCASGLKCGLGTVPCHTGSPSSSLATTCYS